MMLEQDRVRGDVPHTTRPKVEVKERGNRLDILRIATLQTVEDCWNCSIDWVVVERKGEQSADVLTGNAQLTAVPFVHRIERIPQPGPRGPSPASMSNRRPARTRRRSLHRPDWHARRIE